MPADEQDRERGRLLRERRLRAGLSQEALGQRSGVSARTIREIEAGRSRPQAGTVRAIAEVLGLAADDREALLSDRRADPGAPRTLPPAPARFTGREHELSILDELSGGGAPILVLSGSGGVGKTWLALRWAHRALADFPDGQLFVALRGFDATGSVVEPAAAVRGLLSALDIPPERIPADPDAQVALYRKRLTDKRMLIVLDDARDAAQVRPLLPHESKCLVVVTSRNTLTGLAVTDGARTVPLELLDPAGARTLLAGHLGAETVAREADAVDEIVRGCSGLPLALAIVAAQAANPSPVSTGREADAGRGSPLARVAAGLRTARDRLSALSTKDPQTEPRSVFSWSFEALSDAAARMFRLLALHPGPEVSVAAAASLAGEPKGRTRILLAELAAANLVHEPAPGRFGFHDLLQDYAAELAETEEGQDDREAARSRLLDHYLHSGFAAARQINTVRKLITMEPPRAGTVITEPGDRGGALGWFTAEHPVMLRLIDHCEDARRDTHTWQLAWTLSDYLNQNGHWHDVVTTQRKALAAARRREHHRAQYLAHHSLARAYFRLGLLDTARDQLLEGLAFGLATDDQAAQADYHRTLCLVTEQLGRTGEALEHAERALPLFRAVGDRLGEARTLNAVGWLRALRGEPAAALEYCRESLALHREYGDAKGLAATLDSIGYIHRQLGEFGPAVDSYGQALEQARRVGDGFEAARVADALGDTHRAAGDPVAARRSWRQALDILTDLDHADAEAVRAKLDGRG